MKLKINIDNIHSRIKIKKKLIKDSIQLILNDLSQFQGEVGVVFVDHDYIRELNKKFLNKDNTTDVLSFPLSNSDSVLYGEIFINLDKVKEQAKEYNVSFLEEMNRMIIHGLLHLLDYHDYSLLEKEKMTKMEDYYLTILKVKGFY